ncbi:AAA family ATPase (plasmid) [Pantoea dispersa]|uniref:AAA family ATPase n=1 Tax=Pantoea TaxID=53335 RepID=UPI00123191DB|nr:MULTISPECIES: AAA family ATPase [unclassified Pantoea]KAA6100227.1 ATP-binding protein [Pantoea sp. B_9]KAA6116971.1 ATP-binding protein [Pantoea sp. B_10]
MMGRFTQQNLMSIKIDKLKNIEDLNSLTFTPHGVTAILGANCVGKSSLLHALASSFRPDGNDLSETHKMSEYFKPNPHALWSGTKFYLSYTYVDRASPNAPVVVTDAPSEKRNTRWSPRQESKPHRSIFFIGIYTSTPTLEYINYIKNKSRTGSQNVKYTTTLLTDTDSINIKNKTGYVFNRAYSEIYKHTIQKWNEVVYGLGINGVTYSQVSMGAGEQRVIKILNVLYEAPEYSLILIDEIDLLLHEDAFQRLLEVIIEISRNRRLQVIFTTHREGVLKKSDKINIRYIYKTGAQTLCIQQITHDAMRALTGVLEKPLSFFVEDDFSARIIKKICQQLNIVTYVDINEFGSAINAFSLTAGLIMSGKDKNKILSIIDGDVYSTPQEKQDQINKVISGTDARSRAWRNDLLPRIMQYQLPQGVKPEQYIRECILRLDPATLNDIKLDIYNSLGAIQVVLNSHDYVNAIYPLYPESSEVIIKDVIDLFATTPEWLSFVNDVRVEIENMARAEGLI